MFGLGIFVAVVGGILLLTGIGLIIYAFWEGDEFSKLVGGIICVVLAIGIGVGAYFMITNGQKAESYKRWVKDIESNYDGGLQRTITVVDQNGEILKEYEGKMDIQETSGDKLVFVMDGKKYIIYNKSIFNTIFVEEWE